jgi:hypothetical protein
MIGTACASGTSGHCLVVEVVGPAATGLVGMTEGLRVMTSV